MRILMTNYQLIPWTGSDVYTYTVARELVRRGHDVTVCARHVDPGVMAPWFKAAEIRLVLDPPQLTGETFQICHAHHNVMAQAVRAHCPDVPMVYVSHGTVPLLEQPPIPATNVARYLAVSEEVRDYLRAEGCDPVQIVRNPVDSEKFQPTRALNDKPKHAVVLSNRMPAEKLAVIKEACARHGMTLEGVGGSDLVHQNDLPYILNATDIVFTLGRGAIETMMCGRIPIVYDHHGGDGMVTSDNMCDLARYNFSGRRYRDQYTVDELVEAIAGYMPEHGPQLKDRAVSMFDAVQQVDVLEKVYQEVLHNG